MSQNNFIILCSGPSANQVTPAQIEAAGAFIIAVNHAVLSVKADAFFTCDLSAKIRALLRQQKKGTIYYAAVPPDYGHRCARSAPHREPAERNVIYMARLTGKGPWSHRNGLSDRPGQIHTGNSAYGALGLAYLLGARRIAFLGLDGAGGYAFGLQGQPGDLSHLDQIFRTATRQLRKKGIEVLNGSPDSRVTCFPKASPAEALRWIAA